MSLSFCVVTPSYNQGRFIERTIRSVLSQGIEGLEYVVFDGGSTDETVDVLKRFNGQLRWVSEKDRGQSHAVNKGIYGTSGEIIGWLNSDDVYYPAALAKVQAFFEANPEVDVVYGDAYHIDEQDGIIDEYYTRAWDYELLKELCYLCQPAVFFRRRVVEKYGAINDELHFCMDYEFWLRLAQNGVKFHYLKGEFLAGSRLYAQNKTLGQKPKVHREINQMTMEKFGYVPDTWIINWAHTCVDEKGIPRTQGVRFALALAATVFYGCLKYNHTISRKMWSKLHEWTIHNTRVFFRNHFGSARTGGGPGRGVRA